MIKIGNSVVFELLDGVKLMWNIIYVKKYEEIL